jgi:Tol biopolymer transport system component
LTFGPAQDQRPVFNPSGDTVAFISNRDGSYRLWTVGVAPGSEPRQLLFEGWQLRPWYSQDGRAIYFFTEVNERQRICRVAAAGGAVELLPNDTQGDSRSPFITPDGNALLMHSNRDGQWGMWELPLDGGEPRRLNPPGFSRGSHLTRARNGVMAFDYVSLARPGAAPA